MKIENKKRIVSGKIKTAGMIVVMLAGTACQSFSAIDSYSQEFASSPDIAGWTKIQEVPDTSVQYSGGCLLMNVQDAEAGNETIGYTLSGTLEEKETVKVTVRFVNTRNNYYKGRIQLWNSTGNVLLAESEEAIVYGAKDARYKAVDVKLSYTAAAGDAGAAIQLRFVENCNGPQRDIVIDSVSVTTSL